MLKWLGIVGGCLCISAAYAGGEEVSVPSTIGLFPYIPGVSLYGFGGNGWTATGDVMAPVVGVPQNFTYVDPQIYYHSNPDDYTASVGAGQRWLNDNTTGILGAYVFGDYNHLSDGNGFWFVSPGIERLGQTFDFSLNGYIPVSSQRIYNDIVFADQLGNFSNVTFAGHTQYDELVQTFDSTGWGLDGQVGMRLPFRNTKIYVGGYYFSPKDNSTVGGGAVRAEVPINDYISATFSEAYDSEFHNTLKGGLTIWFGGRHTPYHFNGDLNTRMVDPIQRNLVATAGGSHTAQPVLLGTENLGTFVEQTNISFFVPGTAPAPGSDGTTSGSVGDGTYENPYQGMTQANVDDGNAQNNRNFYINSGTYQAQYNSAEDPNFILLNNDQLYGRTNYFKQEASGNSRPLINFSESGFEAPPGDTNDSLNDLRLEGSGSGAGIFVNHDLTNDPTIPDMNVSINDLTISTFGDGVDVLNGVPNNGQSNLGVVQMSIADSLITDNTGVGGAMIYPGYQGVSGGIAVDNFGALVTINVDHVTIANNTLDNTDNISDVGGIAVANAHNSGSLTLNVNNTAIVNNAEPACNTFPCDNVDSSAGGIAAVNDIAGSNQMVINVHNSVIDNNTIVNSFAFNTAGIAIMNYNGDLTLNVVNSQVSNNTMGDPYAGAGGIALTSFGGYLTANITGSSISGNDIDTSSGAPSAAGGIAIDSDPNSQSAITLNVTNSVISDNISTGAVDASGTTAGGIAALNYGGQLAINVTGSVISGNIASGNDMDGGIAVENYISSDFTEATQVNVSNSSISNNFGTGINGDGGIALENDNSTATLNLQVKQSTIANNQGAGVFAVQTAGTLDSTIDSSIIYGNTTGLDMEGNGTIAVTNPVFFNGMVNFSDGGTITFPNVTPSSGKRVVCLFGTCFQP